MELDTSDIVEAGLGMIISEIRSIELGYDQYQ
jgi:hypothetical protein